MDGIFNIYKESGWTSFDVVKKLKRILKQKKIGHTGTLDPLAQGVLTVCAGKATKLCAMLTDADKTYEAVLLLGVTTNTFDMEGEILKTRDVKCSPIEAKTCIKSFLGEQEQIPPMYSAVKVNGTRLYKLARAGVFVKREPRRVCFYELNILDINLPRVRFEIKCSKGTYIRTLCSDIGEALGCGGCVESLVRTRSGDFSIEESYRIAQLEELTCLGRINEALIPMDQALKAYPKALSFKNSDKTIHNGGKIFLTDCEKDFDSNIDADVRMYDSENNFIGIYRFSSKDAVFYPKKILF